jgi:hypothetical protein
VSAYVRSQRYQPGAFLRQCDLCGIRFRSTELVRGEDGFFRCLRWCIEVPAITRDKISAESQRRKEAPPPPHGQPYDRKSTYAMEELVLRFLVGSFVQGSPAGLGLNTDVAAAEGAYAFEGGTGYLAAGETARYCRDLIVENKRPTTWVTMCTARLKAIADAIVANQNGFGANATMKLTTDAHYGALLNPTSGVYDSEEIAGCGLALLWAYQIIGAQSYYTSAVAVAHYLRNVQAIGLVGTYPTTSDAAGAVPLYTGAIAQSVANATNFQCNHAFYPAGLLALEFWSALFAQAGDGTYGCPNSLAGAFNSNASALLSKMIGDARAFWLVGVFDATAGNVRTGLSATTPAEFFNAYPQSKPGFTIIGSGSWEFQDGNASAGTLLQSSNVAAALRSLFAVEGYSTQVASVWQWLMSFKPNAAFIGPANSLASDYIIASDVIAANPPPLPARPGGTLPPAYDPTLALTTLLLVRDSTNGYAAIAQNGSAVYDWSTTGMLAPIQSVQNAGAFRKAKNKLTAGYFHTLPDYTFGEPVREDYLLLRGFSGLAFQLSSSAVTGSPQ